MTSKMVPVQVAHPMVLVLGPTGSGKSSLAIRLALEFKGEIVNCDSQQIYRGLDIGTAKTPASERRGIPHHLIDVAEPNEPFSAGEYARRARAVLDEIRSRGNLPILCGGTGFYVRGLLNGLFSAPARNADLRNELTRRELRRSGFVHRLLRCLDPASASRIHPNDVHKAIRAVEVSILARTPMSQLFGQSERLLEGYRWLKIGLDPPRAALYERINRRCEEMFAHGLEGEVRNLLTRGYTRATKALESIGYRQSMDVIEGKSTAAEALAETQMQTRRYAKRQLTWFRRDKEMHWLSGFGDSLAIEQEAIRLVLQHLRSSSENSHPPDATVS